MPLFVAPESLRNETLPGHGAAFSVEDVRARGRRARPRRVVQARKCSSAFRRRRTSRRPAAMGRKTAIVQLAPSARCGPRFPELVSDDRRVPFASTRRNGHIVVVPRRRRGAQRREPRAACANGPSVTSEGRRRRRRAERTMMDGPRARDPRGRSTSGARRRLRSSRTPQKYASRVLRTVPRGCGLRSRVSATGAGYQMDPAKRA